MSILAAIFATTKRETSDWKQPRFWTPISHFAYRAGSGVTITDETSLTLPGYLAAIRNIADDIAKVPLLTYRARQDRGKDRAREHPVFDILHATPNREQTSIVFRSLMSAYAMHSGNAVAEITTDGSGRVKGLWPIHPYRLEIKRNVSTREVEYHVKPPPLASGPTVVLSPDDVIHIPGFGFDGVQGMPLLRLAAEAIGLGLAAQEFGGAFFRNGTALSGYISQPGWLRDKGQRLRETWNVENAGLANAWTTPVLEGGAEWHKMGVPPEQAQFLQTRQFQIEEIARVLRIAPHKLQHLIKATHSNIESLETAYVNDTLLPWYVRWEQEIARKLFPREPDLFAEHLVEGLLRGTPVQRAAYYRQMFGIGVFSQNDIREKENQNPIGPEGDVYYVPSNMTRSQDAAKGIVASGRTRGPGGPDNSPRNPTDGNDGGGGRQLVEADITGALRIVFFDAIRRICRAEDRALDRALGRYAHDENGWGQWMANYTERHGEFLVAVLEAPAAAYGRAWGMGSDQVEAGIQLAATAITEDFARIAASRRDGGGVDQHDRVANLAAAIFEGLENGQATDDDD